ncbi:MAG: APC family permease [Microthrixaceae bacterium]
MGRTRDRTSIGLWSVVSIGVGGMVGGGIFAVLGLSAQLARGGAPVAFAIGGIVAGLTAASYAKLAVRFPDRGGTITYINEAFGSGVTSGGLNVLLWLSYIVMLSLYASAFGNYFVTLVPGDPPGWTAKLALTGIVDALTVLNAASAASIGRAEEWIVAAKILILGVFVVAGLTTVDHARLLPAQWASPLSIVGGGMLIFVAYEGFELISNSAEDVTDPRSTLPKAFAISVGSVTVLYVLVAIVTIGVLSPSQITAAEDFALAEAARPQFGQLGFAVIAVAALLSTASAINATLYGATRLTFSVARSGELPKPFGRTLRGGPSEGLLITSVLTLVVANTLDLGRISTMGSAGFLIVFLAVNLAQFRLRSHDDSRVLPLVGATACASALVALAIEVGPSDRVAAGVAAGLVALSFGIEIAYRAATGRSITHRFDSHNSESDNSDSHRSDSDSSETERENRR